ncbi:MAG: pyridoxal-phosphate dependent enzyme [Gemmataceae bacterium]|nr:pyridoxal-phosphate dependent enzyme [Gemmata sp.]MDW8196508.1 pyridoxal-phosphate dependent enzyme [Gemmataceae bacterium]
MTSAPLTPHEIRQASASLPRISLAQLPTPLEELPRFSHRLGAGVRVFIKRDDCTGFALGGNKSRHNEFLFGEAVRRGADVVVWGAQVQSNNCRTTAATCAKLGLECRLYLSKWNQNTDIQGNLLLDYLYGAHVELVDARIGPELNALMAARAAELRNAGRNPFFWDPPQVVPLAAISYIVAMAELAEQLQALNLKASGLYVSSAGATGAGVALGAKLLGFTGSVRLICPMHWPWHIPTRIADDANQAAKRLGLPHRLSAEEIDADESYIAPGYGQISPAAREAFFLLAREEAILTDHVYTAKALAALVADVRAGKYRPGSVVVFIHTGGIPAIFADRHQLLEPTPPFSH